MRLAGVSSGSTGSAFLLNPRAPAGVGALVNGYFDAGKTVGKRHRLDAPQGVRGRNSDNSRLGRVLGWLPRTGLQDGLAPTYSWIEAQLRKEGRVPASAELEGAGTW